MTDKQDKNLQTETPVKTGNTAPAALTHLEAKRAQNLRDNLLKRKAQAKARAVDKQD